MSLEEAFFMLIGTEICDESTRGVVTNTTLTSDSLEAVYKLAAQHDLVHIAGQALGNLGLLGSDELSKKFKTAAVQAYAKHMRMEMEYGRICQTLETAQIPFIPLKGAVIRGFYPEPWLRNSCDIDILVKPETLDAAVAALQETLNYTNKGRGDHDVSLFSASGVHLELHFDMMEDWYAANNSKTVLSRIWEDVAPREPGSYHHCMSDEMLYFYHIAHMAKHFQAGGCGIRTFLDVWVLNHRVPHDAQKREQLLREGGLYKFAQAAQKVSQVWFDQEQPDALAQQMSDYILRAGAFGNQENRAAVGQAKAGGKLRYILSHRIFVPYEALKAEYPILKAHKWLTPMYQVVRWVRMLFAGKLKRAWNEWNTNVATTKADSASVAGLLRQLDI